MKTILCTFFACALFCAVDVRAQQTPLSGAAFIAVCKESMTLAVYDFNSCLRAVYPIACGRALGNKEKPGDMKTPEGLFSVQQIQDASAWTHDFGDGKGEIRGAYGSHFIRLKTPGHRGIGIHGTHDPASIGTRATEGCVRLNNSDLLELVKKYVYVGVHYPFIYLYYAWVKNENLTFTESLPGALALVAGSVILAYLCLKLYDEPVRRFLTDRFLRREK